MLRFIKEVFITLLTFSGSLAGMVNVSNFKRCTSLNNQPCMARPTLIDLNLDKYNQELRYYPFIVSLDRCNGSCNTLMFDPMFYKQNRGRKFKYF